MRLMFLSLLIVISANVTFAQKQLIDSSVYNKWPEAPANVKISNDGKYILYTMINQPEGSSSLIIQSTDNRWKKEFIGQSEGNFLNDDYTAIYLNDKNRLCLIRLGSDSTEVVDNVSSYKIAGRNNEEWLVYKLMSHVNELIVRNFKNGTRYAFSNITDYACNDSSLALIMTEKTKERCSLKWFTINNGITTNIWQGLNAGKFAFSVDGSQVAFIGSDDTTSACTGLALWYYKPNLPKALNLTPVVANEINDLKLSKIIGFNNTNDQLYFVMKAKKSPTPIPKPQSVDVYGYKDLLLQSIQLVKKSGAADYTFVYNFANSQMIRLEDGDKRLSFASRQTVRQIPGVTLLVKKDNGDLWDEWNWNDQTKISYYLKSTLDGREKMLFKNKTPLFENNSHVQLSPTGKYVIYYDAENKNYNSYNISTGLVKNITKGIQAIWTSFDRNDEPMSAYYSVGLAGWTNDDSCVLIYSQYDIFMVDPKGKHLPVNLTNGYGMKRKIDFRLAIPSEVPIDTRNPMLLCAFNRMTKSDGFYRISFGSKKDPSLLTMQPAVFEGPKEEGSSNLLSCFPPIKAKNINLFVVEKMTSSTFPNLYLTGDFKSFQSLTNIHPEKQYNWLTTELVTWKTLDRKIDRGVLYKPENFDPKKKYPMIIQYYEKWSDNLNAFIIPHLSPGRMDIASYVSNGYLVFAPDILFKIGSPGRSAYNAIVSAAKYLSQRPYVDSKKIGLQGHSFGGFQTNYVITHSNLFAAAMSASGMSDFISIYGSIIGDGSSRQSQYEMYRDRMGASLWQAPQKYIENSPVLKANKVNTPLLIMANREDSDVPYQQGIEFFTGLRRLKRKAWMLQYDNQGHGVIGQAAADLTVRTKQFFDYYLKGSLPPLWMTKGVPAFQKKYFSGTDLDISGSKP